MKKRTFAALFCAMLAVTMMASCGDNNTSSTENSSAASGETTGSSESDLREDELVTLDVVTMSSGKTSRISPTLRML